LEFFRRDTNDFLLRLVTMEETRLYHNDPEKSKKRTEWWHTGNPTQKNSESKIRWKDSGLDFLGDQDGNLHIDCLQKGQTINAEYYSSLPVQLMNILKQKRRGKVTTGVL
jgi:hypothetical protein